MDNKLITGIIGVVVVVALLGSALVPVIDGLTKGEKTTNEGTGWIRMDYLTGASYDANVCFDPQGNIRVDTGVPGSGIVNTQTHSADEDTILFASSELSMWLQDGVINILGKDSDGNVFFDQITEIGPIATVMRDGTGSQFSIDTDIPTVLNASSWAYVPKSTGNFGFFDAGTPVDMKDYPVAAVGGGFAGVLGYNDLQTYEPGLYLQTELDEDGKLIGGTWVKTAPEQLNTMEFDPSTITIQPLDPSIIDLDPIDYGGGTQLMSVPTPSLTDGDWGYDLTTVGEVQKAVIVSYSGTGGDVVVPATIGGYDVLRLGKSLPLATSGSNNVFDNTSLSADSTLTISEGIEQIGRSALSGCSGFTGSLIIPSSVTSIGHNAFYGCSGFTGSLIIPSSVTSIGNAAFRNCSGFTGSLIIPSSVTSIGGSTFQGCSGFTGSLIIPSSVTSIGGSAFYGCSGFTGSLIIPSSVTSIENSAFNGCSGFTGSLIIPSSVTSIEGAAFRNCSGFTGVVIMSDVTPGTNAFDMVSVTEVLDLSDTVDYSVDHYGLPNTAEYSDSIGDVTGYVSFIEIGKDGELSGGAAALLIAVPVVVIAGLLVAFVGCSIVKRY